MKAPFQTSRTCGWWAVLKGAFSVNSHCTTSLLAKCDSHVGVHVSSLDIQLSTLLVSIYSIVSSSGYNCENQIVLNPQAVPSPIIRSKRGSSNASCTSMAHSCKRDRKRTTKSAPIVDVVSPAVASSLPFGSTSVVCVSLAVCARSSKTMAVRCNIYPTGNTQPMHQLFINGTKSCRCIQQCTGDWECPAKYPVYTLHSPLNTCMSVHSPRLARLSLDTPPYNQVQLYNGVIVLLRWIHIGDRHFMTRSIKLHCYEFCWKLNSGSCSAPHPFQDPEFHM